MKSEHSNYLHRLKNNGLKIDFLEPDGSLLDCVFVEHLALTFKNGTILLNPGNRSKKVELASLKQLVIEIFGKILNLIGGSVEGGGILCLGDEISSCFRKNYMYFFKLMFESGMRNDSGGEYYTKPAFPPVEAAFHYSYFTIFTT